MALTSFLKFCEALEIKPFFAPLEEINPAPEPSADAFLISVDAANKQLYILHRHFPACLVHVAGTTLPPLGWLIFMTISASKNWLPSFYGCFKSILFAHSDAQNSKIKTT